MPASRNEFFSRLFAESRTALRRYVQRFVGSRDLAEEIVQEAFLRTYERGASVETPRAFLFTTARNLAADAYRRRQFASSHALGDFPHSRVVTEAESLETQALSDEEGRLIQEAVNRLPPKCRAAFALRVFHGCSYKEIAERLGVTVKTVEKHIARGLHETHIHLTRRYGKPDRHHG